MTTLKFTRDENDEPKASPLYEDERLKAISDLFDERLADFKEEQMPPRPGTTEHADFLRKTKTRRRAWIVTGFLIDSGLVQLPDFDKLTPAEIVAEAESLQYAVGSIEMALIALEDL
jgi:hypothetical protein